jgi:hypothetical protein
MLAQVPVWSLKSRIRTNPSAAMIAADGYSTNSLLLHVKKRKQVKQMKATKGVPTPRFTWRSFGEPRTPDVDYLLRKLARNCREREQLHALLRVIVKQSSTQNGGDTKGKDGGS